MNDHDDARDVRTALGGLLVDEPAAPWSVADDVSRGLALQRRRRTTALGGIGLAAALALVVGVVGPWSPTATTPPASSGSDLPAAVVAQLEGYGMTVDAVSAAGIPSGGTVWTFTVTGPEPRSTEGSMAALEVRLLPPPAGSSSDGAPGSAMKMCRDADGCAGLTVAIADCIVAGACPASYSALVDPAVDRFIRRSLISALAWEDGSVVEALVPPFLFDTQPFLTDQQTYDLLRTASAAAGVAPPTQPTPQPTETPACAPDDVKLVPAAGQPSDATGARGLWIEIHARNPEVDCLATAPSSVSLEDAEGNALAMRYLDGVYQGQELDSSGIELTQASGPVRFAITKYRCDTSPATAAATAYVALEGWEAPVAVQVPTGAGVEQCPGGLDAPGNTVYVSQLALGPVGDPAVSDGPGVVEFLAGLGIEASGGLDFAGKGEVGDGGQYAGSYAISQGSRTAQVQGVLEIGRNATSDAVDCAISTCAEFRNTETGTDTGGAVYQETQVVVGGADGDSPYGAPGTRILERIYGDLVLRLVVSPWLQTGSASLTAAQVSSLADAFAVDARVAIGMPAT